MHTTLLLTTLAFTTLAVFTQPGVAAPGDLDLSFGGMGKVITDFGTDRDYANSMAIQGDGKILLAGSSEPGGIGNFALVRYNTNGSLDTTFNGTGMVTTDFANGHDIGNSVAVQNDGKIVVAGYAYAGSKYNFGVARYNTNGSLDSTFNGNGKVTTAFGSNTNDIGSGVAVQADGRIVVSGRSDNAIALVRYNGNGSLDTSFNGTGRVITPIGTIASGQNLAVQSDGKIVVAGYAYAGSTFNFALVRYNANGSLDTTFNGTGKVTTTIAGSAENYGHGLVVQSDGKIVVAGRSFLGGASPLTMARYNANGSPDTSFNGTGQIVATGFTTSGSGQNLAVQTDGKIVVAGTADLSGGRYEFAMLRYNPDGSPDTSLNGTGKVSTAPELGDGVAYGVVVQSDRKILVAGHSYNAANANFAVVRYEGSDPDADRDGIADRFETGTGIYVSPQDTGTSPTNPDTDGDGLSDGQEVNTYLTNPNIVDTDGDGFGDGFEVNTGFNPTSAASTPDALSSIRTAVEYRFNAADGISYRIESSTDLVNWVTVETNIIGTGGVITRFYSIEGQPKRFYRSRRN